MTRLSFVSTYFRRQTFDKDPLHSVINKYLKIGEVQQSNAILADAWTYWPKDGTFPINNEYSTKFRIATRVVILHSVLHTNRLFSQLYGLLSALCTEFRQIDQPPFTGGGQIRQQNESRMKGGPTSLCETKGGLKMAANCALLF